MSVTDIALVALCAALVIIGTFTFRFQRTTLGVCRALYGQNDTKLQATMTPAWLGLLGWSHTGLIVVVTVALWFYHGWLFGVGALVYSLVGASLVDAISPLPTYRFCFRLIEGELDRRIREDSSDSCLRLKEQVLSIKAKYDV